MVIVSNERIIEGRRTGKGPARSNVKALLYSNYRRKAPAPAPQVYDFWKGRAAFPVYDVGNNEHGNCTKSSQVLLQQRSERLEQRKTIVIDKKEIIENYYRMTQRLYGGGDTGAYETDALDEWRNPELTFRDTRDRPMTIDAYVRINHLSIEEVKNSVILAGSKGIKVCFALPLAWSEWTNFIWDIPEGQAPIGNYLPYSWGGHSTCVIAKYDKDGLWVLSTWNSPPYKITWRAFAIYCDEAHLVIDSINAWKKKKAIDKAIDLTAIRNDVNARSSIQISK